MERDQASKFINDLLKLMVSRNGSDLFITAEFPPAIKIDGKVTKVSPQPLSQLHTLALARSIMNDKQVADFEHTKECNFAISPAGVGRFRVNAFMQQGKVGMVLRTIPTTLPTLDELLGFDGCGPEDFTELVLSRILEMEVVRMSDVYQEIMEEGRLQGLQQGLQQGRQEGRQEGQALLLEQLLTIRFGDLSATTRKRLDKATPEQLQHWATRVLTAKKLTEVFRAEG